MTKLNLQPINLQFVKVGTGGAYFLDGQPVLRVTEVLSMLPKEWAMPWVSKMIAETLSRIWQPNVKYTKEEVMQHIATAKNSYLVRSNVAKSTGTDIHAILEQHIKTGQELPEVEDGETQSALNAFKEWRKDKEIEWLASEIRVGSKEYGFAGTVDIVALINGQLGLLDFKSSKQVDKTGYSLQLIAYETALREMGAGDIQERWVLRLPKDSTPFEAWRSDMDYEEGKKMFLHCLELKKLWDKCRERYDPWYRKS